MTAALQVRSIAKTFGKLRAVDNVSFEVPAGSVHGFIGPNGAGKTTTMRICATLELPDKGDVLVEGLSVLEDPRGVRRRLGFMPDSYGAYNATTVHEYLDFFARAYGLRGQARRITMDEVIEFTGLGPLKDKLTTSLSKGMKQRLCLAKTMLHDPAVLILDEPAAGLDPRARVELRELLRALAEMGKAVLISSHILSELSEVCDGVAILEAGKVKAAGTVKDIIERRQASASALYVRCLAEPDAVERRLAEAPFVTGVRRSEEGFVFDFTGDLGQRAELLGTLVSSGLRPVDFAARETGLEDLFLELTEGDLQ